MYDKMTKYQKNKKTTGKIKPYMTRKLALLFITMVLALCGLAVLITFKALATHEQYSRKALAQLNYQNEKIVAKSGDILDCNGEVMATNEKVYILILDPAVLFETENLYKGSYDAAIQAMAECFGLEEAKLRKELEENKKSSYLRFGGKTELTEEQVKAFEEKKEMMEDPKQNKTKARIRGVWFETEYRRRYPYHQLASKVIGYTTEDTSEGLWGLEKQYNSQLRGTHGRSYGYINEETDLERVTVPPVDGNTLVTSIDMNMEKIISDSLDKWLEEYGASSASILAMNPQNGEILSMVSSTDYDLNNGANIKLTDFYSEDFLKDKTDKEKEKLLYSGIYGNYIVSHTLEPGSTAKLMTIAAALEENAITEQDLFECQGSKVVGGHVIRCHNVDKGGCSTVLKKEKFSLKEAIAQSCNVALMDIGAKLGRTQFARYQQIFNLGQKTGIDLPGEASAEGLLYSEDKLNETELATNSFGQGFNVTMIQMASAFSSLINGGTYYQPHIVKQILDSKGNLVKEYKPVKIRETISQETSQLIKEGCYLTVETGTGGGTKIEGYHIGGKTGTAEKLPRSNGKYIVSILTAAPIENPQIVLYVVIDEPNVENQADSFPAQQLAGWIWKDLVSYAGIYSDLEPGPDGAVNTDESWPKGTSYMDGIEAPKTPEQLQNEQAEEQQEQPIENQGDGEPLDQAQPGQEDQNQQQDPGADQNQQD